MAASPWLWGSVWIIASERPVILWKRRWRTSSAIACALASVNSASTSMFMITCSVCPTHRAHTSVMSSTPGTSPAVLMRLLSQACTCIIARRVFFSGFGKIPSQSTHPWHESINRTARRRAMMLCMIGVSVVVVGRGVVTGIK